MPQATPSLLRLNLQRDPLGVVEKGRDRSLVVLLQAAVHSFRTLFPVDVAGQANEASSIGDISYETLKHRAANTSTCLLGGSLGLEPAGPVLFPFRVRISFRVASRNMFVGKTSNTQGVRPSSNMGRTCSGFFLPIDMWKRSKT